MELNSDAVMEGDRKASIQVMNLSFPRCGTMAVQRALEALGYTCWHSTEMFADAAQCHAWSRAQDAKFLSKGTQLSQAEWHSLLSPYTALSSDCPAMALAPELVAAFPNAKIILVERDIESWYRSFDETLMRDLFTWYLHLAADLDPFILGPLRDCQMKWVNHWFGASSREEMQERARGMYREHFNLVRSIVPKERLLEYRLKDGWEPLCRFLGKDVPEEPFPMANDREAYHQITRGLILKNLKRIAWKWWRRLLPVFVLYLSWLIIRRSS